MSYESWLPECRSPYGYPAPIREPEPVDRPPATYAFDGHLSPSATVNPAPSQSIPSWNESIKELRIVLHRHPVSPAFLRSTFNEAKKTHGQIKTVAVFVMHGLGDSQSIRVLQSMGGFTKDETRNAGRGVCYVRDMRKQEPKVQPKVEPKPEPKELNWLETELKMVTDSIEARRKLGCHESFLTRLLSQQADLQKQVASQNSVQDTGEWKELDRQEREIQEQLDELKLGETCQP
jgi:hypothetical protein